MNKGVVIRYLNGQMDQSWMQGEAPPPLRVSPPSIIYDDNRQVLTLPDASSLSFPDLNLCPMPRRLLGCLLAQADLAVNRAFLSSMIGAQLTAQAFRNAKYHLTTGLREHLPSHPFSIETCKVGPWQEGPHYLFRRPAGVTVVATIVTFPTPNSHRAQTNQTISKSDKSMTG